MAPKLTPIPDGFKITKCGDGIAYGLDTFDTGRYRGHTTLAKAVKEKHGKAPKAYVKKSRLDKWKGK